MLPLLCRLGGQESRQGDPAGRQLPLLHETRACRRVRPDHPMELSPSHAGLHEQSLT